MVEWVKCTDPGCGRGFDIGGVDGALRRPHCHPLEPMPARDALGSVRPIPSPPRLIKTRARLLADAVRLALQDLKNGWPLEAARKLYMALEEFEAEERRAADAISQDA